MATTTLKILREVNDYTQEFVAEDILGISQTTYARLEQNPDKLSAMQAQKLSELYNVSIANLLSDAQPIITFAEKSITGNSNGVAGYVQHQRVENNAEAIRLLEEEIKFLRKQNTDLIELLKNVGTK